MGLDSIEILMEVEKSFGIKIPDKEAEKIITVGDFHNLVWEYVKDRKSVKCKSQSLFYKLRQSFSDKMQISKQSITLDSILSDIVPANNRRSVWLNLSSINELEFPALILRKPYFMILTAIGIITILGGFVISLILIYLFDYTKWTLLIPVAGILFTSLISKSLNPKRTDIAQNNFRDFTNKVLILNNAALSGQLIRKEVEYIINQIIIDKSGLESQEVTPDKKIHDDLGID